MIVTHSIRLSTSTEIRNIGVIIGWYLGCNSLAIESLCIPHIYYNLDCCRCEKVIEYARHPHYVILNEANSLYYVPQGMNISSIFMCEYFSSIIIYLYNCMNHLFLFQIIYRNVHQNGLIM